MLASNLYFSSRDEKTSSFKLNSCLSVKPMNKLKSGVFVVSFLTLFLLSCSSGKKALQTGNYDNAVYLAINRLKSNPNKEKAVQTLKEGYQLALDNHLNKINDFKNDVNPFKWESIINEYQGINNLADAIQGCPSCMAAVPNPQKYLQELNDAKFSAAEARYLNGKKLLAENNKQSARDAYYDFQKAEDLYPNYKDAKQMMDDAYWAGLIRVMVKPVVVNSTIYKLSNQYFQDKINEFMQNYESRSFVKFYSPEAVKQSGDQMDQILSLNFDDFVVGQTYVKERVEDVKRDSVKIGETRPPNPKPVYGTVKAKLTTYQKSISSSGLLDFVISDVNGKVLTHEKLPGTFVWNDSWATFNGDDRALTKEQLALTKRKEIMPPAPQDLFIEFTKPIYSQLIAKVNSFYSKY